MKDTLSKFQQVMMAAAFAESGEWQTAKEMTPAVKLSSRTTWMDRIFAAVTFAEAGLHADAIRFLKPATDRGRCTTVFADELGLKGVRLVYGTITI